MNDRTIENYIKNIYHLSKDNTSLVSNKQLAMRMNISPATISETIRKLTARDLLIYEKSYGNRLTTEGLSMALGIVRRHRIWETFLVNELGLGWEEVHEIAEELEHVKNDKLISKLSQILGNPTFDPHGDPIPDEYGYIEKSNFIKLSEGKVNQEYYVKGVTDHTITFLKYLEKQQLTIGRKVKMIGIEEFDHSILIEIGKKEMSISLKVAENIIVQEII